MLGRGHETVVGGEHGNVVVFAHRGIQIGKERLQHAVQLQHMVMRQTGFGAVQVVDVVVARQAHRQDVGCVIFAQAFTRYRRAGKFERQHVGKRTAQQAGIKARARCVVCSSTHHHGQGTATRTVPGLVVGQ